MTNSNTTYNKFSLMTYASMEQIAEVLAEHDAEIKAFAFCEHNRDTNEDGTAKIWHRHVVLYLERSKAETTVKNWFKSCRDAKGERVNTLCETTHICHKSDGTTVRQPIDLKGCTFYLVHEDKHGNPLPNKYHYNWADVRSKNLPLLKEYQFATKPQKEDKTFEILEKVCEGCDMFEMARQYGRDFILNYRKYTDLAYAIKSKESREAEARAEIERQFYSDMLDDMGAVPTTKQIIENKNDEIERLRAMLRAIGIEEV